MTTRTTDGEVSALGLDCGASSDLFASTLAEGRAEQAAMYGVHDIVGFRLYKIDVTVGPFMDIPGVSSRALSNSSLAQGLKTYIFTRDAHREYMSIVSEAILQASIKSK